MRRNQLYKDLRGDIPGRGHSKYKIKAEMTLGV
jgi:hypothetical protein